MAIVTTIVIGTLDFFFWLVKLDPIFLGSIKKIIHIIY
jgi:hypothetical protein